MSEYHKHAQVSANGFYCSDCKKFVYLGLTNRELVGVRYGHPVCIECGKDYELSLLEDLKCDIAGCKEKLIFHHKNGWNFCEKHKKEELK